MYYVFIDCVIIWKWFIKCVDDFEMVNYISVYIKDCFKCNICIEKNGGCNYM